MKFICEKCGEIKPEVTYYTFPAQADCPKCGRTLYDEDPDGQIKVLSLEEGVKKRPEFYIKILKEYQLKCKKFKRCVQCINPWNDGICECKRKPIIEENKERDMIMIWYELKKNGYDMEKV